MVFSKGKRYRNKHTLDIDIVIASDPVDYGDELFMKVRYWNRTYNVYQPDYSTIENVLIKKHHINNWVEV